jgi:MFS family permease
MYEAAQMLSIGIIVLFATMFVSAFLLILIHRNNIIRQENRIKIVKIFSVTPFAFNLSLLICFLCISILQFIAPVNFIIVALLVILYGAGFSATTGISIALFGLYFSVDYCKRVVNTSKKYIVFSIISMIISVMFLVIYLSVLIPLFINYYGM